MTGLPIWGCTTCGRCSRRRDSLDRHILLRHPDGGASRVTFAELVAGIQSGKYHVNAKPQFGRSVERTMLDMLDSFTRGYWEQKGRRVATNEGNNMSTSNGVGVARSPGFQPNYINADTPMRKEFGYRIFVCEKCLALKFKIVYMSEGNNEARVESPSPPCDNAFISKPEIASNKLGYLQEMKKKLPSFLEDFIPKTFAKPILIAQLVDVGASEVIIKDLGNPSLSVYFFKSNEDIKAQCSIGKLDSDTSWISRAMKNRYIVLNDHELRQVANLLKNATFGFVRICFSTDIKYESFDNAYWPGAGEYFIYVADGSNRIDS